MSEYMAIKLLWSKCSSTILVWNIKQLARKVTRAVMCDPVCYSLTGELQKAVHQLGKC